ncbi:MAG TPA: 3-methyl-2-oxobutanoate hydroxymethyltransferase [Bacteroidota bacterium]
MAAAEAGKKVTTKTILGLKQRKERIAVLTAYDYLVARSLDEAGIDIILVGDSLGNVFQGQPTTLPVTLEEMIYHTKAVCRGTKRAMVVVDMPFLSFQVNVDEAVRNCGRVLKETGAEAVKLEGGREVSEVVKRLVDVGIPVMGHLGLTPQSIHKFGSYEVRGRERKERAKILSDAKLLDDIGVFTLVLEKVPADLAKKVTKSIQAATIGIGAGPHCDGQVLVVYDMLGMFEDFRPKFARRYAEVGSTMSDAFKRYVHDVKEGKFPSQAESF